MIVLGLSGGFGHDGAAAILVDGELRSFVEEERLSRSKLAVASPPVQAAHVACALAGVHLQDIDVVSFGWDSTADASHPMMRTVESGFLDDPSMRDLLPRLLLRVPHHRAHAESALVCADTSVKGVVVVDGRGERESASVFKVEGDDLHLLFELDVVDSLGSFYSAATRFAGFGRGGEGKLMGLASYGASESVGGPSAFHYTSGLPRAAVDVARGSAQFTARHATVRGSWMELFESIFGSPSRRTAELVTDTLALDVVSDDLLAARFARWAQEQLEEALALIVQRAVETIGSTEIVLTGGVALNCSANSSLGRKFGLSSFVHALVGDAGTALGAAAFGCRAAGDRVVAVDGPYLGPGWTDGDIVRILQSLGLRYEVPSSLPVAVADLVSEGQIVGWFQGPAEAGPRALGHRSILADPSDVSVRLSVNRIKRREWWRPLAPSLSEDAGLRFCGQRRSRYMLEAVEVCPEGREALPAVTHVDGSSRVHIVDNLTHERFGELLECLAGRTGWAAVLNTSFNIGSEPIVYTPLDAVRTYFGSTLNALVVGPALLRRS